MVSTEILFERSFYIGSYMSGILYGVELIMYFMTLHYLFRDTGASKKNGSNDTWTWVAYSSLLVALLTIDISCNAVFGELVWIEHRDVPGGPAAYLNDNISAWYNTLGTTSSVALNFLGDGLLIWRCYVLWGSRLWIIIFPILIYLGAFSMAVIEVYEGAAPGASLFAGSAVDFGVPYYSLTISLNVIVTLLICGRLFEMWNRVRRTLSVEHARTYWSVAAILIESAAPFSILGIVYVVPYARGSPTAILFAQLWGKFTCLSPQFIVLRVAMGKAWSKETVSRFTQSLEFSDATASQLMSTNISIPLSDTIAKRSPYSSEGTAMDSGNLLTPSDEKDGKVKTYDIMDMA